ncbi:hypothetical protein DI09_11p100 [Mitosporidium daphniae]|uniref:Uncharacterized protein n=1 Tax=Mitosporidium daphniae TaxID=1485682 RepID=A0A098VVM0_9MICR|nr:uncharacterized protein DI09_11p100 [Mitosporidium daphniae]KGG52965.1 hypothetical protein DI09_11p100 [Mitosporidium daphniae]|eukprot:XP_013239392.1 uncharacterized protein DI09_11p100 [Mitosporidium daphniae]
MTVSSPKKAETPRVPFSMGKKEPPKQDLTTSGTAEDQQHAAKPAFNTSLLVRMGVRGFFFGTSLFGFMQWWEHPDYIKLIINSKYAGKYEYLTYLGVAVTMATIAVASGADLLQNCTSSARIEGHRGNAARIAASVSNWLLATAFPMETLITVLYWILRAFDRSLLSSTHMLRKGELLAVESDIAMHLLPFFYVWAELLLFSPFLARPFVRRATHRLVLVVCNEQTLGIPTPRQAFDDSALWARCRHNQPESCRLFTGYRIAAKT